MLSSLLIMLVIFFLVIFYMSLFIVANRFDADMDDIINEFKGDFCNEK